MENKVIVILVDGMRPDGIEACGNPFLLDMAREGASCLHASSVMPSVTLPCHSSLFFSVDPERHGITTNTWMPMVRPIPSMGDAVAAAGGVCGMFYNWEQLRDLNAPGTMECSYYERIWTGYREEKLADTHVTDQCLDYIARANPDFVFLYLGVTDEVGHKHGWMTPQYLDSVAHASECIARVKEACGDRYHIIVTADHGGHDRAHGTDMPEDMVIPIIFWGRSFPSGQQLEGVSIKDIAPTVASVLGIAKPRDWEGKSVL